MGRIKKIIEFMYDPRTAFFLIMLFISIYFIFILFSESDSDTPNSFFHFGPGTNKDNTPSFLGIKIDSWEKVYLLYTVSFLTAFITSYYSSVLRDNITEYVYNPALKDVPFSKFWTYVILLISPIVWEFIGLIQILTTFTLQLQFMIPGVLGDYISGLPFLLMKLSSKTFTK